MTVKELIEKLKEMPEGYEVRYDCFSEGVDFCISGVELDSIDKIVFITES